MLRLLLLLSWSPSALAGTITGSVADFFGGPLATGDVDGDGDDELVVVATEDDHRRGTVYVYDGGPGGPSAAPTWSMTCPQEHALCGEAVALVDVDADGFHDLLIDAPRYGTKKDGRVFVVPGSAAGLANAPSAVLSESRKRGLFGGAIASAGDVNGDGYEDVVIGADVYGEDVPWEGAAFVYLGSAAGLVTPAAHILHDADEEKAFFGSSVAGVGDVNGDGYDDLLVGAEGKDDALLDVGAAYLYLGSAAGPGAVAWSVVGSQTDWSGPVVSPAGDVNGDGYADVIVAESLYDVAAWMEGRVDLYLGSALGLAPTPDQTLFGAAAGQLFGGDVEALGDLDGDGYDDVLIGQWDTGACDAGGVVHRGTPAGLETTPYLTVTDPACAAGNIGSVVAAGDLDGNGALDLVAGGYLDGLVVYDLY